MQFPGKHLIASFLAPTSIKEGRQYDCSCRLTLRHMSDSLKSQVNQWPSSLAPIMPSLSGDAFLWGWLPVWHLFESASYRFICIVVTRCPGPSVMGKLWTSPQKAKLSRTENHLTEWTTQSFLACVVLTTVSGVLMTPVPIYVIALKVEQYRSVE